MLRAFYSDHFVLPLPPGHRFPMQKYARVRDALLAQGVLKPSDLEVAPAATDEELMRAHDAAYVDKVRRGALSEQEIRRLGFPWTGALVERSRRSVGGTIAACRATLSGQASIAVNLAGGTHHAHRSFGAGYCVFNDVAVAVRAMQAEGRARHVAIIDCDVHQGDGTAAIFTDDPTVFTFSIHGASNFPFRKQQSDLDIALDDGVGDDSYLAALTRGLEAVFGMFSADLVIYLAGADPYKGDRLGKLALTRQGLALRDQIVLERCRALGLPVAIVMSGGYAKELDDLVAIHVETVRTARRIADHVTWTDV